MNKNKLYEKITVMVPIKSDEKKDYRDIVSNNLKEYYALVTQLDINEHPTDWDKKNDLYSLLMGLTVR